MTTTILLNHATTNTESNYIQPTVSGDALFAVVGTFDGATVAFKQAFLDKNGEYQEVAQDSDLSFTATSGMVQKKLTTGTYVKAVVTNAGAGTDVTVMVSR
jgi:uncharacterized protein YdbL (DUF1318 family)